MLNHSKIQTNSHFANKNSWCNYSLKTSNPISKAYDNNYSTENTSIHQYRPLYFAMTHLIKHSDCLYLITSTFGMWNVHLPEFCCLSNKLSISIQGRSHWISVTSCLVLGISCWTLSLLNAPFGQTGNFSLKSMHKHCRYLIQRAM